MRFASQPLSKEPGGDQSRRPQLEDHTCWLRAPPGGRPRRDGGNAGCKAISLSWV